MNDTTPIGPWIRRFLLEHMIAERNLSRNTQASYRDTLKVLLPFLSAEKRTPIDRLAIEDLWLHAGFLITLRRNGTAAAPPAINDWRLSIRSQSSLLREVHYTLRGLQTCDPFPIRRPRRGP
jgi:site-specific recombinase XerD